MVEEDTPITVTITFSDSFSTDGMGGESRGTSQQVQASFSHPPPEGVVRIDIP